MSLFILFSAHNFVGGSTVAYYSMWPYEFNLVFKCRHKRQGLDFCGAKKGGKPVNNPCYVSMNVVNHPDIIK